MSPDKLKEAYLELGGGGNLLPLPGDVGDKAIGIALAANAIERFGSIDVLVNNAGLYNAKPFLEADEPYLDLFLRTNLKGTFFTTQAVIPQMMQQKGGAIINIGTTMVTTAIAGVNVTAAISSKGAIHALTIQLAAEYGQFNIRTNVIAVGVVRKGMHSSDDKDKSSLVPGINLLNRMGEVTEIAEMVYAVAKSSFVNGAIINVDGGRGACR